MDVLMGFHGRTTHAVPPCSHTSCATHTLSTSASPPPSLQLGGAPPATAE